MGYVPYCDRAWSEIIPGLFMGGHFYDPIQKFSSTPQPVVVKDEFDLVISLFRWSGCGPAEGIDHIVFEVDDGIFYKGELLGIIAYAELVAKGIREGKKILVRCEAGYNRSGLVVALALIELGYTSSEAIDIIRCNRSQYALINEHFVRYIHEYGQRKELSVSGSGGSTDT